MAALSTAVFSPPMSMQAAQLGLSVNMEAATATAINEAATTGAAAYTAANMVPADIAPHAEQQRQSREQAEPLFLEAPVLRQISRQPRHHEVSAVAVGKIRQTQAPHVRRGDQRAPQRLPMVRVPLYAAFGFNQQRLGLVDAPVIARFVAKPTVPGRRPDYADASREREHAAPRKEPHQPPHKQWRDASRNMCRGEEEAL